ncbi:MAG: 2-hydroxyacyl-CoA dehydratase [Candidatus Omnitrophica bacterium]|nr:2-hydroxyacyl-CoA dehydratase [Candidatus Omnitrophota bacterium]
MPSEALTKVERIYQDRSNRAKALKKNGRKIFGYFCGLTPVELITAAGIVPFEITGKIKESTGEADAYLEAIACNYLRNCLGRALRGEYSFLDGLVIPHACDILVKLYDIWKYNVKPPYAHFINTPHTRSNPSHQFFRAELGTFKISLEKLIGREITEKELRVSIALHNKNRALVRQLYEFRKPNPPLVLGSEVLKIISAVLSLPVDESNELLKELIRELKERKDRPQNKPGRLLIYGSKLDNAELIEMIEASGAHVVMDDLCFGYRPFAYDVETKGDPLKNIGDHYLDKIPCPRFCADTVVAHQADLQARFGHLLDYAKDYNINGVIIQIITYCDPYAFDLPELREFFKTAGLPVLVLEHDYTMLAIQRLKTQVQAFLEITV